MTLSAAGVSRLRELIARSRDWSAFAEHRADVRVEICGVLGYLIGDGK